MTDYNYEIERTFSKYGGEADKGVERTCGNCESYDARLLMCRHADNWGDISINKPNELSCYRHRTHNENERLKLLVKRHQDEANRLRLEEQRRNGTGDCTGCPFRKMAAVLGKLLEECALGKLLEECAPGEHRNTRYPSDRLLEEARQALKKARGEE